MLHRRFTPDLTRDAVQAGRFYPALAQALVAAVEGYLEAARKGARTDGPKAIVAPHAGYAYSGPIAGSAFAPWLKERDRIRRVVILGPSHWLDFHGLALPAEAAFRTPLGTMRIDPEALPTLAPFPQVAVVAAAHAQEHAIEVELPFLQVVLGEVVIVPLVVGRVGDTEIREVIDRLWGGAETRFVISSDLSHYLDYDAAREQDECTARAVEALRSLDLGSANACGYRPLRAVLQAASARGLGAEAVDLRNSGDTAGRRDSVVGYGAFHLAWRQNPQSPPTPQSQGHPLPSDASGGRGTG